MTSLAERINGDLETLSDLPSPSPVLVKLTATLGREDTDVREIEDLIGRDPVLAGRVIQAANAAAFAGYSATSSIHNALLRLGVTRVRRLAMLLGLFNGIPAHRVPEGFWPHSVGTAACSEVILRHTAAAPEGSDPDTIFLAALLHDLGLLVIASHYPDDYRRLCEASAREAKPIHEVEDAVLGIDHATIGARLAAQWLFPPAVCVVIGGHHRVATVPPEHRWNTLVVHLADVLHYRSLGDPTDERLTVKPDVAALTELGIKPSALPTLALEAQLEAQRAVEVLRAP
jgi:HD-like signal output (HDOD) protein